MLSEADRSHLARYEAFLALASEMAGMADVDDAARLLDRRFKYVTRVHSWRYLSLNAAAARSRPDDEASAENDSNDAGRQYLLITGGGGQVQHSRLGEEDLSRTERECWRHGKARMIDCEELDAQIEHLPVQFRNPEILQLAVQALWSRGQLEALFFTSCRGAAFDALDTKFIAMTAQFVHRKIGHLRTERRMTYELRGTLDSLRHTQHELVEAEKLAALGSMVAGVSHEMNTPLANALLMANSLASHLDALDALVGKPAPRRSELLGWRDDARMMGQIIETAVHRAATLVASFKQVAVDQSSERRRVFDLRRCLDDVALALRPGLRQVPWQLENLIPPGIECDSYPGPLGQILGNLIQNAVMHAFDGRNDGRVSISVDSEAAHGQLTIAVMDNGCGIDASTLSHVFEPFFTTRLGHGGSGLGLPVSKRIATAVLGGDLRAALTPGVGTRFVLNLPCIAPHKL